MSFADLNLSPSLLRALAKQKYKAPYPIQEQAIPAILAGRDVLGIAKTGSGKTASYVLPILANWQGGAVSKNRHVDVLVLVPTRELAVQVGEVFHQFAAAIPGRIKTLAVYGGVSVNPQMQALQGVSILVATPGRLLELVGSNAVHLSSIDTLVLDEADKMLNLGFQEEMNRILALLPKDRQNLLFSATLNEEVANIHQILLDDPLVVKIASEENNIDLINQQAFLVPEDKKGPFLRFLIKSKDLQQVLVFTSTVYKADNVANKLRKNGIQATAIHGKKSQGARTEALEKFKAGKVRVLVATDLLSRGIDIQFLPCVINYELPRSPKDYIHRIGRTGRAESPGEAISLITLESRHHFKIIQKKMGKWLSLQDIEDVDLTGY
ncbi:MAG TPA: DEAD/DEAH box helicase [Bacteroidetes bacterium]|nr:DEAD/DEAH box helicase [Bacteroidota bacterium]